MYVCMYDTYDDDDNDKQKPRKVLLVEWQGRRAGKGKFEVSAEHCKDLLSEDLFS